VIEKPTFHKEATMAINRVVLSGNLGATPKLYPANGDKKAMATFSLAVSAGRDREPNWFRITVFDKLAASCAEHLSKGDRVTVDGRLTTSTYEQDGAMRTAVQVVGLNVDFARVAKWQEGGGKAEAEDLAADAGDDDDIPF
jgi:single-strand DNA-binding protein